MNLRSPLETELNHFRSFLSQLTQVPKEQWEMLRKHLKAADFPKETHLVRPGEPSDKVAFVLKGVFKTYYTTFDGKEFIRNFATENTFVAAYSSLLLHTPSNVTVTAMQDAQTIVFSYNDYEPLLKQHFCWQEISRKMAEAQYISREQRQYDLLALPAEERFLKFFNDFPELKNRISQTEIANFLGITPVSLSRLRAQINRKTKKKR